MNISRRNAILSISTLASIGLTGCFSDGEKSPASTSDADKNNKIEQFNLIKNDVQGLTYGPENSQTEVIVFFDPMCRHCANYWSILPDLTTMELNARWTWVPTPIVSAGSMTQSLEFMRSSDKKGWMDSHVKNFANNLSKAGVAHSASDQETGEFKSIIKNLYHFEQSKLLREKSVPTTLIKTASGEIAVHIGIPDPSIIGPLYKSKQ